MFTLGSELVLVMVLWAILAVVSGRIPYERGDYGFMFGFTLIVQSIATLRVFAQLGQFANLRCEACFERYHGDHPLAWLRPLHRGCAHCGARFVAVEPIPQHRHSH